MKAWRVNDRLGGLYSIVVFAETPGRVKSVAKATDFGGYLDWTGIRVTRVPSLDVEYRGHSEMSWDDDQDRLALIKAGFHCDEADPDECRGCVGRADCEEYRKLIGVGERHEVWA